ncbi:MAG: hypothetical protein KJ747_04300 [Actinobacteria bacterium]|nr:hypothetical protein [Actinomycetota bacterium]MCG2807798.1 hypothetical protein [Coriobacteriia bacterium]
MNLSEMWKSRSVRIATTVVAVFAIGLGLWSVLAASGSAPAWLPPFPGTSAQAILDTPGAPGPDGTSEMAAAPLTPAKSTGTDSGTSTGNPADDPATPSDTKDPAVAKPGETMTLRILLWNDTEGKAPKNLEVAVGAIKWIPADPTVPNQSGDLAGLAVGKDLQLEVYPDGRTGKKLLVTIRLTPEMRSGSDADAVHVEVRDDQVRVLGTPVDNFDVTAKR